MGQTFYFIENNYLFWSDASNLFGTMLLEVPSGTEMLGLVK